MKFWAPYQDYNGLVIQNNGDGGDSLNRSAAVWTLLFWNGTTQATEKQLSALACTTKGKYRRNNHPFKWYSDCNRTSRDQLIPLLIYFGSTNKSDQLKAMFIDHCKRALLFAYNTRRNFQYPTLEQHLRYSTPDVKWDYSWKFPDLTGPEFWALYIRGFNIIYLYPLLMLFDVFTLIGAIVMRFQKSDDVINHAMTTEYARRRMDTPFMWLARKITSRAWLQARLDSFFGVDREPPINELFRQLPEST